MALDTQAECSCRGVQFVGLIRVAGVMVLSYVELVERPQARDLAQFFRRASFPELAPSSLK